jgi:hypothetical protein
VNNKNEINIYQRFGGNFCFNSSLKVEAAGSLETFLPVGYAASCSRRVSERQSNLTILILFCVLVQRTPGVVVLEC